MFQIPLNCKLLEHLWTILEKQEKNDLLSPHLATYKTLFNRESKNFEKLGVNHAESEFKFENRSYFDSSAITHADTDHAFKLYYLHLGQSADIFCWAAECFSTF